MQHTEAGDPVRGGVAGVLPFVSLRPRTFLQWLRHRHASPPPIDVEAIPGGHPWATGAGTFQSEGNAVEPLVDGQEVFAAVADAVANARHSLRILQMSFEPAFVPRFASGASDTMAKLVKDAGARGVEVKLLLSKVEPADVLGYAAAEAAFQGSPGVELVAFPLRAQVQHAKLVVVDGDVGFILGSLFVQAYWDFPSHPVHEPRRGQGIPLVGPRPIHDLAVRLRGPCVADLDHLFAELWNHRADLANPPQPHLATCAPPPRAGAQALQITRTLPAALIPARPDGETGVFEAYLRAIHRARDFVYIENQYLTSKPVAQALRRALDQQPDLQVILLLNPRLDAPFYLRRQRQLLAGLLDHPRVGSFSLWGYEAAPGRPAVQRAYVHSKSAIIDDAWVALGTANLDGFSLHGAAELGLPASRNVECNAILFDGIAGKPATQVASTLRKRLWSEHLGAPDVENRPAGGWLALWRAAAAGNLKDLAAGKARPVLVLPFVPSGRFGGDSRSLRRLGIDPTKLDLLA